MTWRISSLCIPTKHGIEEYHAQTWMGQLNRSDTTSSQKISVKQNSRCNRQERNATRWNLPLVSQVLVDHLSHYNYTFILFRIERTNTLLSCTTFLLTVVVYSNMKFVEDYAKNVLSICWGLASDQPLLFGQPRAVTDEVIKILFFAHYLVSFRS